MSTGAEKSASGQKAAKAALLLARAWLWQGRPEAAANKLETARSLIPDDPEVHQLLSYLRLHQGDAEAAHKHMRIAVEDAPPDSRLHREAELFRGLAGQSPGPVALADNSEGRLRFANRYDRTHHRSGWRYAVTALEGLHNSNGVLFESFLEDPFSWQHPQEGVRPGPALLRALRGQDNEAPLTSEELGIVPFTEPWVGFIHNPPGMPPWFHYYDSPQFIFEKPVWKKSLQKCIGLFALSEYSADWLRQATGKPVSAVLHPTETPALLFDFERFLANPKKLIIQVGWWLRKLGAISCLPIAMDNLVSFSKLWLVPKFDEGAQDYLHSLREQEFARDGQPLPAYLANTMERQHVPNDEFDRLLGENICFVNLIDSSANNAVIECLVRGTPILVNALPAVKEYLGSDYPLYYEDLQDAAEKALDLNRLRAAHDYLLECDTRRRLDAESFRQSVEASEVYQLL